MAKRHSPGVHWFSLGNDPEPLKATLVGWADMSGVDLMTYRANRAEKNPPDGLSEADQRKWRAAEFAKEKVAFAIARVQAVRNLEDAAGAPLEWPADREKIEAEFSEWTPAVFMSFVDHVWLRHFLPDVVTYRTLLKEEVFPN